MCWSLITVTVSKGGAQAAESVLAITTRAKWGGTRTTPFERFLDADSSKAGAHDLPDRDGPYGLRPGRTLICKPPSVATDTSVPGAHTGPTESRGPTVTRPPV